MTEGESMELIKNYVTKNRHYKKNRIIPVKRIVIHSVGCSQPNPDVFFKKWNTTDNQYLAQVLIGAEKAYEVLPCTKTKGSAVFCYHVGNANGTSIGIEMTEPSSIKYTGKGANYIDKDPAKTKAHVLATYFNAVDITAQLCEFHGLDPLAEGVVLSHSECYKRKIGTNHGDPEHLWKNFGLTMDKFRKDVAEAMKDSKLVVEKFESYLVKVTAKELNIRSGPSTSYKVVGSIKDQGAYTIIEESNGWGKLKSKLGWISLKYTKKI